ncbi:hypothetical protein [Winogradskyella poriferorum]|uniref:Uncharacterized protein n=1 Tax=Winogradskyella poriferorum TaxID=307627 RepID=A0ABU7W9F1_9FLAO
MTETVELRNKPELKFILNTDEFNVIDASEPENNGTYSYTEIKSAELNSERTNWLISILSVIIDFLTGSGNGGKFKTKANLTLKTEKRNLKIWLNDADYGKAKKITELINKNKTYTQQRL